jgi:hypothetical protein
MNRIGKSVLVGLAFLLALQSSTPPAAGQGAAAAAPLSKEQIDQLVAPIALYPDGLLAQVLMASTYPLEVVEAARWAKQNPDLKGDALEGAMQKQTWDASVKSLTAFPQVLTMMDDKLDWTQKLGDAFLAQQKDVMDAVQRLRAKAEAEGNLESNEQQKVVVEQAPAGGASTTVIQIEPANPEVVYVPTYNPTVVYGSWPYPSYPPYAWYPPGYAVASSMISFGVGLAVGSALWGNCNWGGGDVDIDVNRYNEFNRTDIKNNKWQHNTDHRKGVQYRDKATSQRYGRDTQRSQSREQFRGRAEQGRQDLARGGTGDRRAAAAGDRAGRAPGDARARADTRSGQRGAGLGGSGGGRERTARREAPSAFQGMGSGGEVRRSSERGRASRQSAASSGYRGGGGRSSGFGGGGGMRGGGGGGGGGRAGGGGRGRR